MENDNQKISIVDNVIEINGKKLIYTAQRDLN